ncbi:hypothetical protein ACET3X_009600 [Alternaria dauci]|uniref:Zn(2)-C6 fungal-type domain-containing protein n=1 Tax=Alternaria dauci TaxID=48095 RepID=A0ABR3U7G9_9PLEO
MKLACLRCKRKKIKCDKAEPVCHQCIAVKEECQYVERRQRPRHAQQKAVVQHLSQRLEMLERQISDAAGDRSSSVSELAPRRESMRKSTPVPSPDASLTVADGQESWIYRLATDTRRSFQDKATPVATPTSNIDNAMSALNEALEDLGKLRVRTEALSVDFKFSTAEARSCIDGFFDVMSSMLVPDAFANSIMDFGLLRALPEIIDSPFVNVDPGMRVMYYNAMYYGLQLTHGSGEDRTKKAYMKVLESVPAWLESSNDTSLDVHAAALSAWTALTCHDYQLAWKFHCKSCQHIKSNRIDQLDVVPAKSFEEESRKDIERFTYWYILSIDTFFRLFYGKPTVLQYVPNKVRPPLLFRSDNMQPSALHVTISAVWIRYTLLTVEMISYVDNHQTTDQDRRVSQKTDETCLQMEALMDEWKLHELMNATDTSDGVRCLVADHIMNIYATIIGLQRLVRHHQAGPGSKDIAVRAARRVLNIILNFYNTPSLNIKFTTITDHFITLYPFCVVFTLYEHILACNKPEDCESDIQILENIGAAMAQSSTQRRDLVPFERTINALNRVSRTLQEERRKESTFTETREHFAQEMNLPPTSFDTIQNLMASELPDIDMSTFLSMPDYTTNLDGDFQSLGFFRAIENDFVARNWQTDWWDLGGGADITMSQIPDAHPPEFPYQAPNT